MKTATLSSPGLLLHRVDIRNSRPYTGIEQMFQYRGGLMLQAVWVEIPVKDIERAMQFYQTVFELEPVEIVDDGIRRTATLFNGSAEGVAGISLDQTRNFEPSDKGVLVYMDAGEDSTEHLRRVEAAGGKVVEPQTSMGGAGNYATILDTEGNMLALYSYKKM
jgi:uncharacterized protein